MKKQIIPLSSFVISLVALIEASFDWDQLRPEWAGILVAVLGILVTSLVAWQVFSVVAFDKRVKDIEDSFNALHSSAQDVINKSAEEYTELIKRLNDRIEDDMKIMESLIAYSSNHGPVITLECCVKLLKALPPERKFARNLVGEFVFGKVSDIVGLMYECVNEGKPKSACQELRECVSSISFEDICSLEAVDYSGLNKSDELMKAFRYQLRLLIDAYPKAPEPILDTQENTRPTE